MKVKFYKSFNCLLPKAGRLKDERVTLHLVSSFCRPYLLYATECLGLTATQMRSLRNTWHSVAYLRGGGGGATAPPLWSDRKFFWLILHCFVGFISRPNHIKSVSRGMNVCIIAGCYYTDVHARPEASSDMSVFTITAGWLPLANFNRRTVARAVHQSS